MKRIDFIRNLAVGLTGMTLFPRIITSDEKQNKPVLLEHFYIAGYNYYNGDKVENQLKPNVPLTIKRESDNPHDRKAISLWYKGHKLGFVPRHKNTTLAKLLDQQIDIKAVINAIYSDANPWNRVFVDIITYKLG